MKNKMNFIKKGMALLLAIAFTVALIPTMSLRANAASDPVEDKIPKAVRIYPRSVDNSAISISLVDEGYKLTGLKSSDKNLKVYNTYTESSKYGDYKSEFKIGCYALKAGKYKVSFTLVKGKKKTSKSVTVFAKDDGPIKSVKFAGKRLDIRDEAHMGGFGYPDTGAFKVVMNKGYKLTKIEVQKHVKSSYNNEDYEFTDSENTVISNGATVSLCDLAYRYFNKGTYDPEDAEDTQYMCADTAFIVSYIDKYSKEERRTYYYVYKLVNWEH